MSKTFSKRGDEGRTKTSSPRRLLKHSQHWKPPALLEDQDCVRPQQAADSYYKQKICLSAFDNKRYILPDGIKTLSFGHYEIVDYAIDEIDWNNDDVEWDYDNFSDLLLSSSPEWDNSFVVPNSSPDTTQSSNTWQPPDAGFVAAQNINDSDIESSDIVDFDASFEENSTPDNPFINFEAEEASESESEGPVCKTARRY